MRAWQLVAIVAGATTGIWLLSPTYQPPPDFTAQGFTSVCVEFSARPGQPVSLTATTDDPTLVASLIELLRTGRSVPVCRCAALGRLVLRRADDTTEQVLLMPAYDAGSVEYRAGRGRYRVDRGRFLNLVKSLDISPARWHSWPDI